MASASANFLRDVGRLLTRSHDLAETLENVVRRPTRLGGTGISLVGHHEILFPLLVAGVIESVGKGRRR